MLPGRHQIRNLTLGILLVRVCPPPHPLGSPPWLVSSFLFQVQSLRAGIHFNPSAHCPSKLSLLLCSFCQTVHHMPCSHHGKFRFDEGLCLGQCIACHLPGCPQGEEEEELPAIGAGPVPADSRGRVPTAHVTTPTTRIGMQLPDQPCLVHPGRGANWTGASR